jgi:hypothetical protein
MAWSIYRFNARLVTVVIMNISTRKCNAAFVVFTHAVILALAAIAKISPVIIDIPHKSHARCLRAFYTYSTLKSVCKIVAKPIV